MNKKIGVLSDLHLEGSNMDLINPGWDILILAGDISSEFDLLERFFSYQCPQDIPVIYVLGNHEYEGKRKDEVVPKLKELLKDFPNVHLLQNESVVVDGIKFIGTTMWSNFEGSGINEKEKVKEKAKFGVVDFSSIFKKNPNHQGNTKLPAYVPWTPDDMEREFKKSYEFLEYELKKNPFEGPKFVVTHFAPDRQSVAQQFSHDIMNAYWVNDLPELMGFSDYWVHGHTHHTFSYEKEGTKVICNPRGYSRSFNLSSNVFFEPQLMVEIEMPEHNVGKKIKP